MGITLIMEEESVFGAFCHPPVFSLPFLIWFVLKEKELRKKGNLIVTNREDFLPSLVAKLALCFYRLGCCVISLSLFQFYYSVSKLDFFLFTPISISIGFMSYHLWKVSVIISLNTYPLSSIFSILFFKDCVETILDPLIASSVSISVSFVFHLLVCLVPPLAGAAFPSAAAKCPH